jgi:hypothetical protein
LKSPGKYIDQLYHFKGKWDVPSVCGLKVVEKSGKTIVIATNLYDSNTGTSISRWSAQLASDICNDLNIIPGHLVFVEHNPDLHSKLDFYKETFDVVEFSQEGDQLYDPVWKRISKKEVDEMITL